MKAVVGLGNPGKKYKKTRHNIGYCVIDAITKSSKFKVQSSKLIKKFNAEIAQGKISDEKILLVKPQTFMNESGKAVKAVASFYKINPEDIWVLSDDIDLQLGKIRIRLEGSSGGHKGLQSIIDCLSNQNFPRIRIGIRTSKADKIPAEEYVLQKFSKKEINIVDDAIEKAIGEIKKALKYGIKEKTISI
jgi:PTH1 family peptidyl-tRNA hydrolase